jgi:hypothetical protein
MVNLDFNADSKVNVSDLVTAIKVFKALDIEPEVIDFYMQKLILLIYPNINKT